MVGNCVGSQSLSLSSDLKVSTNSFISVLGFTMTVSWDLEEVAVEEITLTWREAED